MTYKEYCQQFHDNLLIMSRTANGVVDVSASATKADSMETLDGKKAKETVQSNIDNALIFLYENRYRDFSSGDEIGDFIIEVAKKVNKGIVKEGSLFRNGEDSKKYPYARIAELPRIWKEFCDSFYKIITFNSMSPIGAAGYAEYNINRAAHFFSDGCGKISMLISLYVCMRYDISSPVYISREDYYAHGERKSIPYQDKNVDNICFFNFIKYYRTLFKDYGMNYDIDIDISDKQNIVVKLKGTFINYSYRYFANVMQTVLSSTNTSNLKIDCSDLKCIDTAGTNILAVLSKKTNRITLHHLNNDCYAAVKLAGLGNIVFDSRPIPHFSTVNCDIIGEGSNGIIYRINDEIIIKAFKRKPVFDDILKERMIMKNALIAGLTVPISFGFGEVNNHIVLVMEFVHANSLVDLLRDDAKNRDKYMDEYVSIVKKMHSITGDVLNRFPKKATYNAFLVKIDKVDQYLPTEYQGKIKSIVEKEATDNVLTHGDIQPSNVMISEKEISFIDLETLSSGPTILDIGSLFRTLYCYWWFFNQNNNDFLRLDATICKDVWHQFINKYYAGNTEEYIHHKDLVARLIGCVYAASKLLKTDPTSAGPIINRIKELLDELN